MKPFKLPPATEGARSTACGGSALEAALARLKEAQEILAEAPDWKPAQERVRDAEAALDRENTRAVAALRAALTPNDELCGGGPEGDSDAR
jgi:hypothetical protein